MSISQLVLESIEETKKKKKWHKLALAGGLAALGAGGAALAYRHHKNIKAESKERVWNRRNAITKAAVGAVGPAAAGSVIGGVAGAFRGHPGKGAAAGAVAGGTVGATRGLIAHGVNKLVASGITRLVHGKDSLFNRNKKADLRRKLTTGFNVAHSVFG